MTNTGKLTGAVLEAEPSYRRTTVPPYRRYRRYRTGRQYRMKTVLLAGIALVLTASACKKPVPPPLYEPVAVAHRDIVVSAEAAGVIEPILVVDVKSRASGTILQMRAQTGDHVRRGDTLVLVDRRDPTNTLNQASADHDVARAELTNAQAQKTRVDQMFTQQLVSQQEYEAAQLTFANARAKLVRAETAVQTARDALDDTSVRAPVSGTIIAKNVEVGNVIASATRDVSGGVVLLKMADLSEVQVRTLVDETDIGKIQPGLEARVTVDAYPNQPFRGRVLKIEPQSTTTQNVTMFPVLITIANENERLKPGMNASVQIQVRSVTNVLAIPNAALRTQRDVGSAAQVLGLNPADVQRQLALADSQAGRSGSMAGQTPGTADRGPGTGNARTGDRQPRAQRGPGAPTGQPATAPAPQQDAAQGGIDREAVRAAFQKMQSGQPLSPAEQALLARARAAMGGGGGGGRGGPPRASNNFMFGGSYIVFVLRRGHPAPVRIRTGVTDLDYSEVSSGLTDRDTVILLPSASLVQSNQDMKDRFTRMTGGGGVPGMQQQAAPTSRPATSAAPGGRPN